MKEDNQAELNDLKEIAIGKIKVAFNRSIDAEATHSILWDMNEKKRNLLLKIGLIISLIIIIFAYLPFLFGYGLFNLIFSLIAEILAFLIAGIIIYGLFLANYSKIHKQLLNAALLLRTQSLDFLQYKLDSLDKQGFIEELKSLEVNDKALKDKTQLYTDKLSTQLLTEITRYIEELEKTGFKKHIITQEVKNSATEKLQKFTALRTSEVWIKFE